jgi:chemotaxis protein MotA
MNYALGFLVAVSAFVAAMNHLHQSGQNYADFVAFVVVAGGTLAVGIVTFPWRLRAEIARALRQLAFSPGRDVTLLMQECLELVRNGGTLERVRSGELPGAVLRDGAELIGLGLAPGRVREILEMRIVQAVERQRRVANAFRSLAKYPPAFGLVGTVLGLVNLMRHVAQGADARETGLQMAIALVATLYGLIVSNLLLNPAGEAIQKNALDEQKYAEVALNAVVIAMEHVNALEAQEVLNSFLPPSERVNALNGGEERMGAAA